MELFSIRIRRTFQLVSTGVTGLEENYLQLDHLGVFRVLLTPDINRVHRLITS